MIRNRRWILSGFGLALLALGATAQTVESTPTGTRISASAESIVTVKPDQAQVCMGVVTEADTSQEAGALNASGTEKLLVALKQSMGAGGEFKTSGYWVNPQMIAGPRDNKVITKYVARNSVEVTIYDLTIISRVIDAVVKAGANNVSSLRFSVKDEEGAKTAALVQATSKARDKAAAMANALGLRVRRVVSVTDAEVPTVMPLMMESRMAMADTGGGQTPVEPGMLEVRSRVTVTVEAN